VAASKNTEREAREARERLRRYTARQTVHAQQLARRRRDNLFAIGAVVVVAALATVGQLFYFNGGPGTATPVPSASSTPTPEPEAGTNVGDVPDPSLAEGRQWTGELTLNDVPLGITLDGAAAPQAVASFIAGVQSGYYIDKTCHRLVSSDTAYLIQCGSIDGAGSADPDYSFGPIENAAPGGVYPTASIAMARGGNNAYSNGRQFFIVLSDSTLPDDSAGGYTVFGTVTSGLDQLISEVASAGVAGGGSDGQPVVPTTIKALTIQ
jgi:peptidyl-prolyl cis-trans isomerase B (cyclophilin B)